MNRVEEPTTLIEPSDQGGQDGLAERFVVRWFGGSTQAQPQWWLPNGSLRVWDLQGDPHTRACSIMSEVLRQK